MINDLGLDLPVLALFLKFMIASTALLGGVWLLEKLGVINSPDISETAWKAAIIASFVALLPISLLPSKLVIPVGDAFVTPERNVMTSPPSAPQPASMTQPRDTSVETNVAFQEPRQESVRTEQTQGATDPREAATQFNNNDKAALTVEPDTILLAVWALLAAVALLALLVSYKRAVGSLGNRQRVPAEHHANQTLRALCEQVDIRHVPYLSRSSEINSPVCLPRREICLPDWAFDDMEETALDSLIAHELAHMVRKDPIMMIVTQTLCRIFFFQPLFGLARRRLEDNAELAADEWAATHLSTAKAVATALYTCAQKITEKRQLQWGLAMAGDKSILKQRVERLLAAEGASFGAAGAAKRWGLGALLAAAVVSLPGIEFASATNGGHPPEPVDQVVAPLPAVKPLASVAQLSDDTTRIVTALSEEVIADDTRASRHIENMDGTSGNIVQVDDGREIKFNWDGRFTLTDDENSVLLLSRGATVNIRTNHDGEARHRVRFEADGSETAITYWVDGEKQQFDRNGEKWLAETLEVLLKTTAIDMENRVARALKKGGTKEALKKLEEFEADYIRRVFVGHLVEQAELSARDVKRLLSSLDKMHSSYEIRLAMGTLVGADLITEETLNAALELIDNVDSDYELRLMLVPLMDAFVLDDKNMQKVLERAKAIESDYELRLLLTAAMSSEQLSPANQERLIDAAKTIDSDYELRLVLVQFASDIAPSTSLTKEILDAVTLIGGDYEKRLALVAIIDDAKMDTSNWLKAIDLATNIGGDYEKRLALSKIRDDLPRDDRLQRAFRNAAETIRGDYERSRLLGRSD